MVQAVLHDNLQLLKACHLLDPTYFTFVMAVVKASSEMYSHKFRRTGKVMLFSVYSMCNKATQHGTISLVMQDLRTLTDNRRFKFEALTAHRCKLC